VECRGTLRIFAHNSIRPSIMTYGLGIARALTQMCDLSWSAIAVLPMSYCNVRPPVPEHSFLDSFCISYPRHISLYINLLLFSCHLPTNQTVCQNVIRVDGRSIVRIVVVVISRFCFRTRADVTCGSNTVESRCARCATTQRTFWVQMHATRDCQRRLRDADKR
jgi:hypothetical protein